MRVAVIMPLYHQRPQLLEPAIASILAQTHRDFHLMVFIDGANRETRDALHRIKKQHGGRFSVHNAHKANQGIAGTLNDAHDYILQRGGYDAITWVSSDNFHFPEMLELMIEQMARDPQCDVVFGRSMNFVRETGDYYDPLDVLAAPTTAEQIRAAEFVKPLHLIVYGLSPVFLYSARYASFLYEPNLEFAEDLGFMTNVLNDVWSRGRTARWAHRGYGMRYAAASPGSHTSFLQRNKELFIYRMGLVWQRINDAWAVLPYEEVHYTDPAWAEKGQHLSEALPPKSKLMVLRVPAGEEVAWSRRVYDSGRVYHCVLPEEP